MFPEAGGSSSFARRAFNEFWSFFAAWGQMLTYIITIAISAFFVPHYLGVFWEPLGESPADIFAGIVVVVILGGREHRRRQGVRRREHRLRGRRLPHPGPARDRRHRARARPGALVEQVDFGTTPDGQRLPDRDPGRDGRLHRHRDDLEHGRGGARLREDDPARHRPRGRRRGRRSTPSCRRWRCPRCRSRTARRQLALPKEEGGYADDPVLGVVENMDLGSFSHAAEIYVGILAATILFIATNAGHPGLSRGSATPWASTASCPEFLRVLHPRFRTPVHRDRGCSARSRASRSSPARPTSSAMIYAFGAMLSFTMAHAGRDRAPDQAARHRAAVERARCNVRVGGRELPMFAVLGGLGTGIAFVVATRARPETCSPRGHGVDGGAASRLYVALPAPAGPCAHARRTRSSRRSPRWSTRSSTSRSSWRSRTTTTRPRPSPPPCGSPRGAAAASTCS